MKFIAGHIIDIKDRYRVLIDRGAEHGVLEGMKFVAYSEGKEVLDLEGKPLGHFENIKANLKFIHVQDKFSLLESDERIDREGDQ